jgi:uncharacterized protein (DUF433 family)
MLQIQTVKPELLAGLNYLMQQPMLASYRLVGGTALALQFGHRISIDIDMFGSEELNQDALLATLANYGDVKTIAVSKSIKTYLLNGVKVDFVTYNYPWISDEVVIDAIRMASPKDISAMKLNAIVGRGLKKDFVDVDLLLSLISLPQMLKLYQKKYAQDSIFMVLKSLGYFEDADLNEDPIMLVPYNWNEIKNRIIGEVKNCV